MPIPEDTGLLQPGEQKDLGSPNRNLPESVKRLTRRQSQAYS